MFASCVGEIAAWAERCVIECDPRLVPLFERSFPTAHCIAKEPTARPGPSHVDVDLQVPIGSLPRFLRTSAAAFPQRHSYLTPNRQQQTRWRERLAALGTGLKVGISWRGGKDAETRRKRSTDLHDWSDVLGAEGVCFINLQYGETADEIHSLQRQRQLIVNDLDGVDPLVDLDGFAALISALDLVISVDNANVHLAGALGVRVWTLLPLASDWRWLLDRDDSPWYPSMRLFRQVPGGDWQHLFSRVAAELKSEVALGPQGHVA